MDSNEGGDNIDHDSAIRPRGDSLISCDNDDDRDRRCFLTGVPITSLLLGSTSDVVGTFDDTHDGIGDASSKEKEHTESAAVDRGLHSCCFTPDDATDCGSIIESVHRSL
jgi:hypothetical protein